MARLEGRALAKHDARREARALLLRRELGARLGIGGGGHRTRQQGLRARQLREGLVARHRAERLEAQSILLACALTLLGLWPVDRIDVKQQPTFPLGATMLAKLEAGLKDERLRSLTDTLETERTRAASN